MDIIQVALYKAIQNIWKKFSYSYPCVWFHIGRNLQRFQRLDGNFWRYFVLSQFVNNFQWWLLPDDTLRLIEVKASTKCLHEHCTLVLFEDETKCNEKSGAFTKFCIKKYNSSSILCSKFMNRIRNGNGNIRGFVRESTVKGWQIRKCTQLHHNMLCLRYFSTKMGVPSHINLFSIKKLP